MASQSSLITASLITASLDTYIREQTARWTVPGVVIGVRRDGEREIHTYGVTSLETGYPIRPDTLFPIGSIGKVYTAVLVMTLVDEGVLDLDALVIAYLPELRLADERARDTVTLRQLLSHQSGLFGDYYDDFGMGDDALAHCVVTFANLRQFAAPGELRAYCSSGFMLAGRVVEVVTGQPFETAMRERVFRPLDLDRSFLFVHEAIAYPPPSDTPSKRQAALNTRSYENTCCRATLPLLVASSPTRATFLPAPSSSWAMVRGTAGVFSVRPC